MKNALLTILLFGFFGWQQAYAMPITPPYTEDFESFPFSTTGCNATSTVINGWLNETTDGANWLVDADGTLSPGTGPDVDFNPGNDSGKYLYLESSPPCSPNVRAALLMPAFDFTGISQPTLDFWYHMLGVTMGNLHIDVSTDGGTTFDLNVIPAFTDNLNSWQQNTVDLTAYANEVDVTIRFRGVTGVAFSSDMAIDYVSVYEFGARNINVSVTGLATGNSVVLQNNGGDDLTVSANGNAAFITALNDGSSYDVTVLTQPTVPNQVCTVTDGSGQLVGVDITNITVACVTNTHTVGGLVSGLVGSGLTLQNNGGDDLSIGADGNFTFPTALTDGSAYIATVLNQPSVPNQTCNITNDTGTLAGINVTNIMINCVTNTYTIGGTISGLATGNSVVFLNNAGDNLTVNVDGNFTFSTALTDRSAYAVTLLNQPTTPNQVCTVTNGSGNLAGADVTDVMVNCVTDTHTISGVVSGLVGSGLILQNNAGDDLNITADGAFTFATALTDSSAYVVTVSVQPGTPSQVCSVSSGSGLLVGADVTDVIVNCSTNTFTIGGTVTGLVGSGLTLQNNAGDDLFMASDGAFTFATALADLSAYVVTVSIQPGTPSQDCSVSSGSGSLAGANVTDIIVSCSTNTFTIGGTVIGLVGSGLTLQNNAGDDLSISADGAFTFVTALTDLSAYVVTVSVQPSTPSQVCSISSDSGSLTGAHISDVIVNCSTNNFTIAGTVTGLVGSGLVLQNNAADDLNISADGIFTFSTALADLSTYVVTVLTQPTSPSQACIVTSGSGSLLGTNVSDVIITCPDVFPVIELNLTAFDFESVILGDEQAIVVSLTNTGSGNLNLDSISAVSDPFSLAGGGCLNLPLVLLPSETCEIEVLFSPVNTGPFEGLITITSNAASSPDELTVTGSGVPRVPVIIPVMSQWSLILLALLLLGLTYRHRRYFS